MKNKLACVIVIAAMIGGFVLTYDYPAGAQGDIRARTGAFSASSNSNTTVANCPTVAAGSSTLCVVSTGVFVSNAGGAYFLLSGGGATVVNDLKIGTKTCNLGVAACVFNVAASASQPITTAPAVTVTVN